MQIGGVCRLWLAVLVAAKAWMAGLRPLGVKMTVGDQLVPWVIGSAVPDFLGKGKQSRG
jgi:hypothetical protein